MISKKEFEDAYGQWVKESESGSLSFASNSETLQELESFQRLVDLGEESLPFIVEKLQEGNFLLNYVMEKIIGIRIFNIRRDAYSILSRQDISKIWIEWWRKNRRKYEKTAQNTRSNEVMIESTNGDVKVWCRICDKTHIDYSIGEFVKIGDIVQCPECTAEIGVVTSGRTNTET